MCGSPEKVAEVPPIRAVFGFLFISVNNSIPIIHPVGYNMGMRKIEKAPKKTAKRAHIQDAILLTKELEKKDIKHPKMYMPKGIIKKDLENDENARTIVFANYRNTIDEIVSFLNKEEKIKAAKLIGQKSGLTQKEQISTIKDFEDGTYNVMIGTSILEEGLDISTGAKLAIFYDIVPSEIRAIQRKGRVGRTQAGKIIFLVTNNTREQGYKWSAYHKEKTMKKTLQLMQKETQSTLIS